MPEFAAEISRQSRKSIGYVNLPEAGYKDLLVTAGLPEVIAELHANSDTGASKGALFDAGRQPGTLIGRPTTSLTTVVAAARGNQHRKEQS